VRPTRIADWISTGVAAVTFVLMVAVVFLGAYNAIARHVGKHLGLALSSNALIELQWQAFGAIFLLAAPYTLLKDAHVRVDVLFDRLPKKARAWIDVVGHAAFLLPFCGLMVYLSWPPVRRSWELLETSPDPGGLPFYPIKTLIPLTFVLLGLQGLAELIKRVHVLRRPEEAEDAAGDDEAAGDAGGPDPKAVGGPVDDLPPPLDRGDPKAGDDPPAGGDPEEPA